MTGFAAACYQRGVPFIQVPTTLLAQVDSSVGGKTAVNHSLGKNMIGAFYQPQAVIIDTDTLATLPDREFCAGLAEVIKYGLIADAEFFHWLEDNLSALLERDSAGSGLCGLNAPASTKPRSLAPTRLSRGCGLFSIWAIPLVTAIETFQGYTDWLHGEAVAAGMVMAAQLSVAAGDMSAEELQRTETLIEACGLPIATASGYDQ